MPTQKMPITTITEKIADMGVNTFFPDDARDAGKPYIERHSCAGGSFFYTVWKTATLPAAVNLEWPAEAAFEYGAVAGIHFTDVDYDEWY